jgi:hypothetical protein
MFFHGCGIFVSPVTDISEIAYREQTGLLGSAYTISFRNDGTANCECSFYSLDENKKPNLEFVENICSGLYRKDSSIFIVEKGSSGDFKLNGSFTGNITKEQFEKLAQNLQSNDFFSIVEKESGDVRTDAPPNFIKVVYAGKTKEVSDANNDLSSIETSIIETADKTTWLAKEQ